MRVSHRFLTAFATAAVFAFALGASSAPAAPGDLDPSFGTGGRATIDVQDSDYGFGGALAPDGKVLITGDVNNAVERASGLARLTPAGAPDPAFGGGLGFVTKDPTPGVNDYSENVQLQPDGKILVGGSFDGDVGILRYRPDGLPDTGFDGDGVVKTEFGHDQRAGGVLLLPDGKLLWFGRGDYPGSEYDLDLVRYNADGSLDGTFGSGGLVSHSIRSGTDLEQYSTALLQPDGKILIGGEVKRGANGFDWTVIRLNPDGSFDNSFDGDGRLATSFLGEDYLYGLALQPDGRIVAVGVRDGVDDIVLARYLPDGELDPSFDGDGKRVIDLGGNETGRAVALQPDGKIVVAGQTDAAGTDDDMVVSRLLSNGSLDSSFGVAGTKLVGFGVGDDEAHDLMVQPDGRIVVVGWAVVPGSVDFAAIRLEGDPLGDAAAGAPGATPAPTALPDSTVAVRILGARLRFNRRGVAHLRLRCPATESSPPCQGRLVLRTRARLRLGHGRKAKRRPLVLARARFRLAQGKTKAVRLRLKRRKLRLLRHSARARRVVAIARARDAAGNRGVTRRQLAARFVRSQRARR